MAAPIRILHLSDFHFREDREEDFSNVFCELGETVAKQVKDGNKPDIVVLTGDIAWSGKKKDYSLAQTWIDNHLLKHIVGFDKKNFFIIPGNHDVDREKIDHAARCLDKGLQEGDQHQTTGILKKANSRRTILERQQNYLEFANKYQKGDKLKTPWFYKICKLNDVSIGFAGLATSLVAYGDDKKDYGNLVLGDYQVNAVFDELKKVNIRVALLHHPVSYLISEERRDMQRRLVKNCSLILRGHLHEQDSLMYKTPTDQAVELATGSAYHDSKHDNTFQFITLDTNKKEIEVQYWLWKDDKWIIDRNAYITTDGYSKFPLRLFNNFPKKSSSAKPKKVVKKKKRKSRVSWQFVKQPLSWQAKKKLNLSLCEIHKKVYMQLKKTYPTLRTKQVRANVFLPDYVGAKSIEEVKLYIPDYLRVKMNYEPEWDIKLTPSSGATGITFIDGNTRYTKRLSKEEGEWDSRMKITKDLKKIIHKNLKWIYSIPLKDPLDNNVILGVMNIDGLGRTVREKVISETILDLYLDIHAFISYLSQRKREIISY